MIGQRYDEGYYSSIGPGNQETKGTTSAIMLREISFISVIFSLCRVLLLDDSDWLQCYRDNTPRISSLPDIYFL